MNDMERQKTELNARAKASMRTYLRNLTWEQKVDSIARMNAADKLAKRGMREAIERETRAGNKKPTD